MSVILNKGKIVSCDGYIVNKRMKNSINSSEEDILNDSLERR
jgi:hypothetical protein